MAAQNMYSYISHCHYFCFYETEKCVEANIPGYPTWIINNKQYPGVKSIEELKQLTGC